MRILTTLITFFVLGFFWVVDGGYTHIDFLKKIGSTTFTASSTSIEISSISDKVNSKIVKAVEKNKSTLGLATSSPRVITHIKTPEHVKAIYMSSWVASAPSIREKLVKLIDNTEINSVVIDVKDNTGVISWDGRVRDLNDFVDYLHSKNIYVIARVASFQDPLYVKEHPDQAVHSKSSGGIWHDHKGAPWVDTGSKLMWTYLLNISRDAYARGFDEINLDYIRFPTDGALSDMTFPVSGERAKNNKPEIVGEFYKFITSELHKDNIPVSGDLFGIIMITKTDILVLGQDMHTALQTFDYVSPMVYPSHFYPGTDGFKNPAEHPGEIISFSMKKGVDIAGEVASSTGLATSTFVAKYRPFYQDFDMGAVYTADMVRAQIAAGEKLGIKSWMLWDPANHYTPSALKAE